MFLFAADPAGDDSQAVWGEALIAARPPPAGCPCATL